MFSRRAATNTGWCQSWKDLTQEEMVTFSASKTRATCHLNRDHAGDHEDKILGVSWTSAGWPNNRVYWSSRRDQSTTLEAS